MLVITTPIGCQSGGKPRFELHVIVDMKHEHLGRMTAAFSLGRVGVMGPVLAGRAGGGLSLDFHFHDRQRAWEFFSF
jgi:hypothetical protein